MRNRNETREDDEVGQQARPTVGDERQRYAGQWQDARHAPGDERRLRSEDDAESGRGERVEIRSLSQRDEERARTEHHRAHHDGDDAGQAQGMPDGNGT